MRPARLTIATVAAFVLGAALLLAFEHPVTLILGVVLLLTFVVLGTFLIASPEYLAPPPDDRAE